jgi:hypothetical protein
MRWVAAASAFLFFFVWDVTQNNAAWFHGFADLVRTFF